MLPPLLDEDERRVRPDAAAGLESLQDQTVGAQFNRVTGFAKTCDFPQHLDSGLAEPADRVAEFGVVRAGEYDPPRREGLGEQERQEAAIRTKLNAEPAPGEPGQPRE